MRCAGLGVPVVAGSSGSVKSSEYVRPQAQVSSPDCRSSRLAVQDTALITAGSGISLADARQDHAFWDRIVESTVGAHIINAIASGVCEGYYWRDRNREVDFVLRRGRKLVAIEVKSGRH